MELLGKIGIDLHILVAQIINFTLLLFILNKFIFKPVLKEIKNKAKEEKTLKEMQLESKKNIKDSERIKKEEISKAKIKAKKLIDEAEDISKFIVKKAKEETKKEKEDIIRQLKSRL